MPSSGFVFLATTKTGSTAIERALQRHAEIVVRRPPRLKHATARTFDRVWAPVLEHYGHAREDYELVCVVREPVEWAHSWWRYRSRPEAAGSEGSTAGTSFDEFAERIVSGELKLGTSTNFVRVRPDRPPVDRVYRYEHLPAAVEWMAGRLGIDVPDLGRVNTSPRAAAPIAAATRALLTEHYASDAELHARAL